MYEDDDEPISMRPRISVAITQREQERLQKTIPWGLQSAIIRTLMNGALDIIDEYGELGIAALLSGKVSTIDILRNIDKKNTEKRGKKNEPKRLKK